MLKIPYRNPLRMGDRDPVLDEILAWRGAGAWIAKQLGVSSQAVYQWRRVPEQHIKTLSKLLHVSQAKLRGDRDE